MTTGNWVEVILIALLVANMVAVGVGLQLALKRLSRLVEQVGGLLRASQAEAASTLADAHRAIGRIEALSQTTERVLGEDLSPVLSATRAALGHLEDAARGASASVQAVRRIASSAESIITPAAALAAAGRALRSPGGKATMAAALIGIVTQMVSVSRARGSRDSSQNRTRPN